MPIKNLTDRASVTPRFTRLGVIRKGERTGEGRNTKLVDLEYFRFTTDRQEVAQAFFDAFGEQPVSICCFLPYRTMEENWQTWKEEWGYSGLIHRCDGETMVQWLNADKTYTRDYEQSRRAACPYACGEKERTADNPGCSEVGRLSIIIPKLLQAGFFGYVTVETHSIHDLANITSSIVEAENKAREFGCERGLQGIGFVLRRQFEEVGIRYQKRDGDYVRARSSKWMIRLDPSREWALRQMEIAQATALALPTPTVAALPSAVIIDDANDVIASLPEIIEETGEVIDGQFDGYEQHRDELIAAYSKLYYAAQDRKISIEPIDTKHATEAEILASTAILRGYLDGKRPLDTRTTIAKLRNMAGWKKTDGGWAVQPSDEQEPPHAKDIQRAAALLELASGTEDNRHTLTDYIFAHTSLKNMTRLEVSALMSWAEREPGSWEINPFVREEARQILASEEETNDAD